ncbi:hypothetical protein B0T17DRAFT_53140 [Bombardia bombarda]|uniref:Secreted protein n=1 Tax=Bombardia bombarda TaxID=252184 RepID=A0AA39XKI0_9PEZI|nr:hypothetical protein B0T17DRAFT_53140 [Bombardia bombarda]
MMWCGAKGKVVLVYLFPLVYCATVGVTECLVPLWGRKGKIQKKKRSLSGRRCKTFVLGPTKAREDATGPPWKER